MRELAMQLAQTACLTAAKTLQQWQQRLSKQTTSWEKSGNLKGPHQSQCRLQPWN